MKRRALFISGLVLCLGALALFLYGAYFSTQPSSSEKSPRILASIEGFEPGVAVTYRISPEKGEHLSGKDKTDAQGFLRIPDYDLDQNSSRLSYNFEIEQGDDPIQLKLNIRPETATWSVSGQGLERFSDIALESYAGEQITGQHETKTDWAGFFNKGDISYEPGETDTQLKLAMFGNIQNDAAKYSALKIEVQTAPGGGGPTSSGVNVFNCATTNLSVCQFGSMQLHINDILRNYVTALMLMTEQFSAVMMQQVGAVGTFFDAKMQMQTQREFQKLQAEAHKDYHPSEQMCQFGSFVKTVAKTEEKAAFDNVALSNILMTAYTANGAASTIEGYSSDMAARLKQFRESYCDPSDNNNGLNYICDHDQDGDPAGGAIDLVGAHRGSVPAPDRMNKDIDFGRSVDLPLTLDVDFTDVGYTTNSDRYTEDEEDMIALARNLYWPKPFEPGPPKLNPKNDPGYVTPREKVVMDARKILAIQNIAHHSFSEIVGLKGKSKADTSAPNGPSFMKALMRDFGLTDADIEELLGEYPSYYAQMEVLTKKIYQSPSFYTNLYTKPVNIDRVGVSMDAIKLMQTRDHFDASLRREMLYSMMVEEALAKHFDKINTQIDTEAVKLK